MILKLKITLKDGKINLKIVLNVDNHLNFKRSLKY